jgi:hypothetical protein
MLTAIGVACTSGFLVAWRIQVLRSRDRHETRSHFEQQIIVLQEHIQDLKTNIEGRITAIEHFNAGTVVVLEHMQEFRKEVKEQYEKLRRERSEDMGGIHRRLDTLHNVARGKSEDGD